MARQDVTLQIVLKTRDLTKKSFRGVVGSLKRMKDTGSAAFASLGKAAGSFRGQMVGIVGAVGAWRALVRAPADFAEEMAKIGTLGKEARDSLADFTKEVRAISIATGTGADDLAKGLFDTISAGVDAGKSVKFLAAANKLAIAGSAELSQTVRGLTGLMEAYGLSADEAEEASKQLFATQVIGKTTVEAIAGVIGDVATSAANASVPIEQMSAALAQLTLISGSTEGAATAVRAAILAVNKPTEAMKQLFTDAGLAWGSAAFHGRTLGEVFGALGKEARAQGKSFEELGVPARALTAFYQLGAEDGQKFADALTSQRKATGELQPSLELMGNTLNSNIDRWKNLGLAMADAFSSSLLGDANEALGSMGNSQEYNIEQARQYGLYLKLWGVGFQRVINWVQMFQREVTNAFENAPDLVAAMKLQVQNFGLALARIGAKTRALLRELGLNIIIILSEPLQKILNTFGTLWHGIRVGFELLWGAVKLAAVGALEFLVGHVLDGYNAIRQLIGQEPIQLKFASNLKQLRKDIQQDLADAAKAPVPEQRNFSGIIIDAATKSIKASNAKLLSELQVIRDGQGAIKTAMKDVLASYNAASKVIQQEFDNKNDILKNTAGIMKGEIEESESKLLQVLKKQTEELEQQLELRRQNRAAGRPVDAPFGPLTLQNAEEPFSIYPLRKQRQPGAGAGVATAYQTSPAAGALSPLSGEAVRSFAAIVAAAEEAAEDTREAWDGSAEGIAKGFQDLGVEMSKELLSAGEIAQQVAKDAAQGLQQFLGRALDSIHDKTVDLGDAFRDFVSGVARSLQDLLLQNASNAIIGQLGTIIGGAIGGGVAGAARGKIIDREEIIRVGEGGRPEIIIPTPGKRVPAHLSDTSAPRRLKSIVSSELSGGIPVPSATRGHLLPDLEVRLPSGPTMPVELQGIRELERRMFTGIADAVREHRGQGDPEAVQQMLPGRKDAAAALAQFKKPIRAGQQVFTPPEELQRRLDGVIASLEDFGKKPRPDRRFAFGGLVRRPTQALLGEGVFPEAVVRAPGGSIPVDLQGADKLLDEIQMMLRTAGDAATGGRIELHIDGAEQITDIFRAVDDRLQAAGRVATELRRTGAGATQVPGTAPTAQTGAEAALVRELMDVLDAPRRPVPGRSEFAQAAGGGRRREQPAPGRDVAPLGVPFGDEGADTLDLAGEVDRGGRGDVFQFTVNFTVQSPDAATFANQLQQAEVKKSIRSVVEEAMAKRHSFAQLGRGRR